MKKQRDVILGPPGTGKTTDIVRRLKEFKQRGVENIALLSFTKAGAAELAKRAEMPTVYASTIHSLAFRQAGVIREQVVNQHKLQEFAKAVGIKISGRDMESEAIEVGDEYLAIMQLGESLMVDRYAELYTNSQCSGDYEEFKYFVGSYRNWKKTYGLVDFNDMLKMALKSPRPVFDVMFIDEAQDLSPLQWKLISYWTQDIPEVIVAGDDDQAIYVWGGADPQGMHKFKEQEKADVHILNQSYRVPESVHRLANKLTERIVHRMEKIYKPRSERGEVRHHVSFNPHTTGIAKDHSQDVLVLYRNHSTRGDVEDEFIKNDIPYIVEGGKAGALHDYRANAIRYFINYQLNPSLPLETRSLAHMERVAAPWHKTGLSDRNSEVWDLDWWQVFKDRDDNKQAFLRAMYKRGYLGTPGKEKIPTIRFMTIHNSKGQEADRVILINDMSKRTYNGMLEDPDSETRTWYVGVTRTRHELDIINGEIPFVHLV